LQGKSVVRLAYHFMGLICNAIKRAYTYLVDVNLWQATVGIFVTAGAIYTYVIARFESAPTELPNV